MNDFLVGGQPQQVNPNQPFPPPGSLEESLFPQSSRYHGLRALTYIREDGKEIAYLERRFLPDPEDFEEIREHIVVQGDRLDNLAYQYLGDPEQFWRIADANGAMHPVDLTTEVGSTIRITLPEGIPGVRPNA